MNGSAHILDFPRHRYYVTLEENYKRNIIGILLKVCETKYNACKITTVSRRTLLKIEKEKNPKIRLELILKIIEFLDKDGYKFSETLERNIVWIGAPQSRGLSNPKLPFDFRNEHGARFLAAISGDGSLTNAGKKIGNKYSLGALIYTNTSHQLRNSVIKDAVHILGEDNNITSRGIYVIFPFILRDTVDSLTNFKGKKSETNPNVPGFILNDTRLIAAWIGQVISDEGNVRYYPNQYERSITWRRSVDVTSYYLNLKIKNLKKRELIQELGKLQKNNLLEGERKALKKIGIKCILKPIEIYYTKGDRVKLRWELRISREDNLLKLRKLITIPYKEKDEKFTRILKWARRDSNARPPL